MESVYICVNIPIRNRIPIMEGANSNSSRIRTLFGPGGGLPIPGSSPSTTFLEGFAYDDRDGARNELCRHVVCDAG